MENMIKSKTRLMSRNYIFHRKNLRLSMFNKRLFVWISLLVVVIVLTHYYTKALYKFDQTMNNHPRIRQPKVDELNNYAQIIRARAEQYQRRCGEMNINQDRRQIKNDSLRRVIVNDEDKLLYCWVPKIACSNLRRTFLILTGKTIKTDPLKLRLKEVNGMYSIYIKSLTRYSSEQIDYRLRNYRKILFVREPFERLLSAYKDRFQNGRTDYEKNYGREIIRTFRVNASEESLKLGNDVTFKEFVQYIIHRYKNKQSLNHHWTPFTKLCPPCQVQYDFIGRFDTVNDDVDFLLKSIGKSDSVQFPHRNETYKKPKTMDVLYQFYRDIDPDSIATLRKIYENDSKLFDYKVPEPIRQILGERRL